MCGCRNREGGQLTSDEKNSVNSASSNGSMAEEHNRITGQINWQEKSLGRSSETIMDAEGHFLNGATTSWMIPRQQKKALW